MNHEANDLVALNFSYHFIQEIRLAQAVMESDYRVSIPKEAECKFRYLKRIFPVEYAVDRQDAVPLRAVEISHAQPFSRIGSIEKGLIFPHGAFRYCHNLWKTPRAIDFCFVGLVTQQRHQTFQAWLRQFFPSLGDDFLMAKNPFLSFRSKVSEKIGLGTRPVVHPWARSKKLSFWHRDHGRKFPMKVWDPHYYRQMAHAKFVLCPCGDYPWTYRFFEAIMCGAVPLVEDTHPVYLGFVYHTLRDDPHQLVWTAETAQHNFDLCSQRLTIPHDILNREIDLLIHG